MIEKISDATCVMRNDLEIPRVSTKLCFADRLGALRARWGFGRMDYKIAPGLYAMGEPDGDSPVLVSANYKLSFDALRKELAGLDTWIVVLDTRGVNVWCAAGKGTFGADELVRRIELLGLDKIVNHRKIIVPQLAATGVAAHLVRKRSGFTVIFGPVGARDIIEFVKAGNKATDRMRQVRFSLYDRFVLTPMELVAQWKYLLFTAALLFVLSGFGRTGYSSHRAVVDGVRSAIVILAAYLAGTVVGPLLLPWLPGKSFSFKGFCAGLIVVAALALAKLTGARLETIAWILITASAASFLTMNFTGASTYTSLSGVKKEMRIAVPLQIVAGALGLVMWIVARFV